MVIPLCISTSTLALLGKGSGQVRRVGSSQRPVDCDIQGKACIAVMAVADREALGMESPHGVSVLPPS